MVSLEQKKINQKYILDNLDKYVIDSRGNFVHIDSDLLGSENAELYFIGKEAASNWEEMVDKIAAIILQNKEDWEVVLDGGYYLKNKKDGRLMNQAGFGLERSYEIIGELGYRQGAWKNYEEEIKLKREWKKLNAENFNGSGNNATSHEAEDNLKKEREENEKKETEEQAKQRRLNQHKDKVATKIAIALSSGTLLNNSELSPQYQNWAAQINQLTDIQQISNLQGRILADIQARRQDKITAQEVKEGLNKVKTGTKKEQEQSWKNLEKQETEKGYNSNQEEIENLKKQKATENPQKYNEEAKKSIEEKLKVNGVKEDELSEKSKKKWQKLKNNQITDPNQLVVAENKIKQNIYQKKAEKRITDLTTRANKVLKLPDKSQIATVKKELLSFLSSNNIYYTSSQKKIAESLLTQLENYSDNNDQSSSVAQSKNFPWQGVISFLLIGSLLAVVVILKKRGDWKRKKTK